MAEPLGAAPDRGVEKYLAALTPDRRTAIDHLRAIIHSAVPDATEVISYQMPAFKWRGRRLVYYAAFRNHLSLFPASYAVIETLRDEVAPFLSGKTTLRFTVERPLPDALITRIVRLRVEEVAAKTRAPQAGR